MSATLCSLLLQGTTAWRWYIWMSAMITSAHYRHTTAIKAWCPATLEVNILYVSHVLVYLNMWKPLKALHNYCSTNRLQDHHMCHWKRCTTANTSARQATACSYLLARWNQQQMYAQGCTAKMSNVWNNPRSPHQFHFRTAVAYETLRKSIVAN